MSDETDKKTYDDFEDFVNECANFIDEEFKKTNDALMKRVNEYHEARCSASETTKEHCFNQFFQTYQMCLLEELETRRQKNYPTRKVQMFGTVIEFPR